MRDYIVYYVLMFLFGLYLVLSSVLPLLVDVVYLIEVFKGI